MRRAGSRCIALHLALAVAATGCSGGAAAAGGASDGGAAPGGAPDGGRPDIFIAFASSFQPFRTWPSFHSDGPAPGTVPDNVLGERTQYVSQIPPPDATAFAVGTMIVEVRANGTIFASSKRGANFNFAGARNWEWWELAEASDGTVTQVWRGYGPPNGGEYGGSMSGCNDCHVACADNDYVCSPKLLLGTFNR